MAVPVAPATAIAAPLPMMATMTMAQLVPSRALLRTHDDENEMPKLEALRNSKKIEAYYGDNGLFDVLAL